MAKSQSNELGYSTLNPQIHRHLFGDKKRPNLDPQQLKATTKFLEKYKINLPIKNPTNLYSGDLPFPKIRENDLAEHFESIANDFVGRYMEDADNWAGSGKLPPLLPQNQIKIQPGWTRYEKVKNQWKTEFVKCPHESIYVFDTETFVTRGGFPVIGTAVSADAIYVWLAKEMVDPATPEDQWDCYDLIPLGSDAMIIGHNVSYDRARSSVDYNFDPTITNFWFDTMAAHIAVSGLAADQRWLHSISKKAKNLLTERERRMLRYKPRWFGAGATNSLIEVYNFHVASLSEWNLSDKSSDGECDLEIGYLSEGDKDIRDVFVKATEIDQMAGRTDLINYAIKDSLYTAKLFHVLWPKYREATPSAVGMCSQYFLNSSKIPLTNKWHSWLKDVNDRYDEHNEKASVLLKGLIRKYVSTWQTFLRLDIKNVKPNLHKLCDDNGIDITKKNGNYFSDENLLNKLLKKGIVDWQKFSQSYAKKDVWLSQLDWRVRSFDRKYKDLPQWASVYLTSDKQVTTKTPCAGLLLKLEWESKPVKYTRETGYGFIGADGKFQRIPHPKGKEENVGSLLSKDFVVDMEVGRLSSELPEATEALAIANATSYWTSVRKRVQDRIVMKSHKSNHLVTLPQIVSHGTISRRTVESLMVTMCSTKVYRIGTELKTRIECPSGWKIVGADFDGQELQIASIYADCWDSGHMSRKTPFIGASPLTYKVLAGSKAEGTDAHSALATAMGVSRDVAKIVNFTILYGGGARTVAASIKKFYKEKPEKELLLAAYKAMDYKKGRKGKNGIYFGGTDSGCFNLMEQLARGQTKLGKAENNRLPTLPVLGTKISTALRPEVVDRDFHTGRVNWTIQAAGSEILALFLLASHWLAKEFDIPLQFIISIHDEIWFMVPEQYANRFAVLMQMAHLLTWARFHQGCNLNDVPLTRAYFSDVAIDTRLRKTPTESTVTLSNPSGSEELPGKSYTMLEMASQGWIKTLADTVK